MATRRKCVSIYISRQLTGLKIGMIIATLNPNFIVEIVSQISHWSGEQQRMRVVALCSRRACCKILVSLESLKGTCLAPHERLLMTSAHGQICCIYLKGAHTYIGLAFYLTVSKYAFRIQCLREGYLIG